MWPTSAAVLQLRMRSSNVSGVLQPMSRPTDATDVRSILYAVLSAELHAAAAAADHRRPAGSPAAMRSGLHAGMPTAVHPAGLIVVAQFSATVRLCEHAAATVWLSDASKSRL
ncbi:unnamed protein product [Heligmosomoides polygyrus]|uniref:Uncharacterized protein n=1 Tax=Heligmosomoides polygyrus TaxID=6339 RepID=A0A3P7UVV8_HELPZ|nr:unnamed protein product [Heligmosomoides polygyrus]